MELRKQESRSSAGNNHGDEQAGITHIQAHAPEVRSRWCTNEKTAMEAALGMSYAGKRSLVCMKHVGMNVAADAFVNSAITGINGGLVVLAADDPSMHSSQNEQDSRFYGKFAMIPIMEPSSQQEAYDMMPYAYALSEELKLPILMRVVTRLAHSRARLRYVSLWHKMHSTPIMSVPTGYCSQAMHAANTQRW